MRFGDRNPIPLPTTQLSDRVDWNFAETPPEIAAVRSDRRRRRYTPLSPSIASRSPAFSASRTGRLELR